MGSESSMRSLGHESGEVGHPAAGIAEEWFRHESARLVALLAGSLGVHRLQLAEDVVQEALARALETWPLRGVPENPAAWLTQTARNLALDQLRRDQRWQEKEAGIALAHDRWLSGGESADLEGFPALTDGTLRMLFVCCHPQLASEAQTALALRTLCGLSAAEIAAAFLSTEAAIAKRLVRARQRIRELGLVFEVPDPGELPARLDGVLGTLYLLFNEGYKASTGSNLVREELCHEAIRLALLLVNQPITATPKAFALVSLMLLNAARLPGRTGPEGQLLRLSEQDRSRWNPAMIHRGIHYLGMATQGTEVSEYHLEAGIAACHTTARGESETNWVRILALYDQLVVLTGSPIVRLNRAVALSKVAGPTEALLALEAIETRGPLADYHPYHAVRGTLLLEAGRPSESIPHLHRAAELTSIPSERRFLQILMTKAQEQASTRRS